MKKLKFEKLKELLENMEKSTKEEYI